MKSNIKSIKKLPEREEVVQFLDKNGKVTTKTVKISDRYLIQLNEFNSVVISKKDFKRFGIKAELEETKPTTTFGVQTQNVVTTGQTSSQVDPK